MGFSSEKTCIRISILIRYRLSASQSHRMVAARTPARRGPAFVCARRRGLCSMSGRYPYGIDNPPTLRCSSFPQRALRPAGGPIPKRTWGCAPRPPNAQAAAGYERCESIVRTAPQIRSQGACGAFYFGFCRDRIKNQPYKRRLIPLREAALWLSGRGVPTRYGSLGRSPE